MTGSLVGKTVVVGFNLADSDGGLIEKRQRCGSIISIDEEEGVLIREQSGSEFSLPPTTSAFRAARPGVYRMRSTGEVVENPDFEAIWTVWAFGTDDEWWEAVSAASEQTDD